MLLSIESLFITLSIFIIVVLPSLGSSDHVETIMDEVEKYMMTRLYKEVFCPETTDDEKKDLAIQKRIRLESWTNTYIFHSKSILLRIHNGKKLEIMAVFCSRALHWVTIEMLCVPVDEEIPEVSDSVVKAITGGCDCFTSWNSGVWKHLVILAAEFQVRFSCYLINCLHHSRCDWNGFQACAQGQVGMYHSLQ